MTTAQEDINKVLEQERIQEKQSLTEIVAKIKEIGAEQYDNKLYDNIYSIFNQLTVKERRMLLKGVINILLIVEDKTQTGGLVSEPYRQGSDLPGSVIKNVEEHLNENLGSIESFNKMEMIKLKSRLSIIAVLGVVVTIFGAVITSVYFSNSKTETIGLFAEFSKIITEVLGF
jgi:hypothetical protein